MRNTHKRQPMMALLVAASSAFSACTESKLVDDNAFEPIPPPELQQTKVQFSGGRHNNTRATLLQDAGHYNFGVFGYIDDNPSKATFQNYLVGYYDEAHAYGTPSGSTFGDPSGGQTGVSYWMYEGLGAEEYTGPYAGQPLTDEHRSNVAHQYMYYWDTESASTTFYAYAPYIHGGQTATYDAASHLLTLPAGIMHDGYDDATRYDYLYATTTVENRDYGNDVFLPFRRLGSKVNIRFYEVIDGYTAQILDLGNGYTGVHATPAIRTGDEGQYSYSPGIYYSTSGASVSFSTATPVVSQLSPEAHAKSETLHFEAPADEVIGTTLDSSTPSATTYYAIPKTVDTGGLTFHVTYRLTSDMGEQITVRNATAHIPADKCNWRPNVAYTYIFRITRESNGSTNPADDQNIDPSDPNVPPIKALYSIIFDSCTMEEWLPEESEHYFGK